MRQPDPREAVRLIEAEGVTHLCGAPVVVSSLAQYCAANGVKFRNPLRIVTAGAPPPPAVIRAAEETGAELTHAYGLTETYGPHTICAWKPAWDALPAAERALLKARQGVPYLIAGTDLRVTDHYMNDVPADGQTMGEVLMRGNNVMLGYYDNPKATEEAFQGGWFHSGDLAVVHPDGYIELRDRMKDIVISGGENISSIEVEKALADHPAVAEVAIVAVADEKWGEVPKAYVGLKPNHSATAEELIAWCRERLSHFKCPKHDRVRPAAAHRHRQDPQERIARQGKGDLMNLQIAHEGPTAIVTLNRPERRNALSLELMLDLIAALDEIGRNREIRAVILAAAGKVFCSGHDLGQMTGRDINEYRRIFDVCTRADAEAAIHSAARDRRSAGHRHRRRLPVGGHLRSGHRRRGGRLRHARREDRTLLHHADGGPDARHRPQARPADAAHRRDGAGPHRRRMGPDQPGRTRRRSASPPPAGSPNRWPTPVRWWSPSASRPSTRRSISISRRPTPTPRK